MASAKAPTDKVIELLTELKAKMEADRLKLESIKAAKLSTLERIGVPEKYTVDLASKQFS